MIVTGLGSIFLDKKTGKKMQYAYFGKTRKAASSRSTAPINKSNRKMSQEDIEHEVFDRDNFELEHLLK